jgi:hypothetical protein
MGGAVRASESAQSTTARSSNDVMPREDDLSADD